MFVKEFESTPMKSGKQQKPDKPRKRPRKKTAQKTKPLKSAAVASKSRPREEYVLSHGLYSISNSVCFTDLKNRIIFVNPAFLRTYGYTRKELIGKDIAILLSPSNPPGVLQEVVTATLRGGWQGELVNRRKDGSEFPISLSTSCILDESGKPVALMASLTDITSRRRAEEELRQSEERYRTLVENASDIIYRADATGHFTFFNPAAIRTLGLPHEAIIRLHYLELIHPEQRVAARQFYLQQMTQRIPVTYYEFRVATKDDTPLWLAQNVQLVINDGKIDGVQAVARDITDRKLAEIALREAQQHHEAMVNSVDGIVWEADARTLEFCFVSKMVERLLGYPVERWLGDPTFWELHIHPEDREWVVNYCVSSMRTRNEYQMEYRMIGADGRIVWLRDLVTVVVKNDEPVLLRGIMVDISERMQLAQQLLQAQKLEGVSLLAGGMAHEFNNVLMIILGRTQLVQAGLAPDDPLRRDLDGIHSAGTRAKSLIRQLLAFSRRQVLQSSVIDVNSIVNDTDHMLRRLIGEDIEFLVSIDPTLGHVRADAVQIEQILVNLMLNARDAMPGGGQLVIKTANVELDETYCRLHHGVQPGPYVMMAVKDTGAGMEAHVQARVFEPFFTTKGQGKGSGLGLSVAYGIVKQSGGHISFSSKVGRGSTFRIYLPRVDGPVSAVPSPAGDPNPGRGTETILLIEDEDGVRELLRKVLESAGYTVLTAARGEEAIRLGRQYGEIIHVVLSDMVMPGMSGLEAASGLASERPDIKVILMSGYVDRAGKEDVPPGIPFLSKPFSNEEVLSKLREVLK